MAKDPNKIKNAPHLTTSMIIQPEPIGPPPSLDRKRADQMSSGQEQHNIRIQSGSVVEAALLPRRTQTFELQYNGSTVVTLAQGVYILAAPTAAGKTTLAMALCAFSNFCGVRADYLGVFEPRAEGVTGSGSSGLSSSAVAMSPELQLQAAAGAHAIGQSLTFTFGNPANFIADLKGVILPKSGSTRLLIIDSVTLPLKTFASHEEYEQQSTFKGGMQPSDLGFIRALTDLADQNGLCIIAVINSTLVDYVASLFGASEGSIEIMTIAQFSVADRSAESKREKRTITIPTPFVDKALSTMGMGSFDPSVKQDWKNGFEGINVNPDYIINKTS
jgi:hypothetical protein